MIIKNKWINVIITSLLVSFIIVLSSFAVQDQKDNINLSNQRFKLAQDAYKVYQFKKSPNSLPIALAYTKSAIELDDKDYKKYVLLGNIYLEAEKLPNYQILASEAFDKAIKLNPNSPELDEYTALAFFEKRHYYQSVDYFEKFITANSFSVVPKIIFMLNTAYTLSGRMEDGCKFYEKFIKENKNSPDYIILSMAALMKNTDQNKQADYYLKKLVANTDTSKEDKDYAIKLLKKGEND